MFYPEMPLAWSDNRLWHNMSQSVTTYNFHHYRTRATCKVLDHRFEAADPDELANLMVARGVPDGTVQVRRAGSQQIDRYDSFYARAAKFRSKDQAKWLNIRPGRLGELFVASGRGLRPEVQQWWTDWLDPRSRPWRVRWYSGYINNHQASFKAVTEILEFHTDADMFAFRFRWLELWDRQ